MSSRIGSSPCDAENRPIERTLPTSTPSIEVHKTADQFAALAEDWKTLYDRSIDPSPPQGFDSFNAAQDSLQGNRSFDTFVVTCRLGSELIGLWPIARRRRNGLRWLENPGFGAGEEYSGPLIDARHDGERIAQYLLNTLAKQGDVLKVTLPEKHPLRKVAPHQRISHQHPILSPVTRLTRWPEFEAWLASKSGSFRKGLRYDRKKLAELGPLRLLDGGGADDQTYRVIDWMFEEKRAWLSRKGVASLWITDERSPELLRTLFRQALPSASGVELWALLVDEIPAAGAICLVSNTAVELFMFVMNPTFAARSPGNLLLEDIAKSAAKRHKDFDFRIGSSDYKARWADDTIYYQTLVVALTWKGCIGALEAETHARNIAFRVWAKREARSLLNRLRPRSGA